MDELPWWVALRDPNSMTAGVLRELWSNPQFAQHVTEALAPESGMPFGLQVGGRAMYDAMPEKARTSAPWDDRYGAATIFSSDGQAANAAGIVVDVDRILAAAGQDSARARELVRDALVHEFGHVVPVARTRSLEQHYGDPKPGSTATEHPVIQQENELRGLLGLQPKSFYGLLSGK